MARNPQLEAAIAAEPDDDDRYLVYADWLQGQGDPRGELIALDHELSRDPGGERAARLRARRAALMSERAGEIQGSLATVEPGDVALEWRLGLVRAARLRHFFPDERRAMAALRAVLASPACALLRSLSLPPVASMRAAADVEPLVRELLSAPRPWLRALSLGRLVPVRGAGLGWPRLGPLAPLSALPGLATLTVCGRDVRLADIDLPALRALRLRVDGWTRRHSRALALASLPALVRCELWLTGSALPDRGVGELLAALPAHVREVGLQNAPRADAMIAQLADCAAVARLDVLDLSMGTLTDDGARALARHAASGSGGVFAAIGTVDVSDNCIGEAGQRALKALPNVRIGFQDPPGVGWTGDRYEHAGASAPMVPERLLVGDAIGRRTRAAAELVRAGNRGEARALYRAAGRLARLSERIARADGIARSLYRMAWEDGQFAEAERAVRERLAEVESSAPDPWHLELARVRMARGDFHHAVELLEDVQARSQTITVDPLELARAYAGQGRWSRVMAILSSWESAWAAGDDTNEEEAVAPSDVDLGEPAAADASGRELVVRGALAIARGVPDPALFALFGRARRLLADEGDGEGLARLARCEALAAEWTERDGRAGEPSRDRGPGGTGDAVDLTDAGTAALAAALGVGEPGISA